MLLPRLLSLQFVIFSSLTSAEFAPSDLAGSNLGATTVGLEDDEEPVELRRPQLNLRRPVNKFPPIGYDHTRRPNSGSILKVGMTIFVQSIGPINEEAMTYECMLSIRQIWMDGGLKHNFSEPDKPTSFSPEVLHRIWRPDVFFPEAVYAIKGHVLEPNMMLRVWPDGRVLYVTRVMMHVKCPIVYKTFPFDSPICSLRAEPYGLTLDDLQLTWQYEPSKSVEVTENIFIAQFRLQETSAYQGFVSTMTGNYSALEVRFQFKRDIIYYLIITYIPSYLVTMLSWVGFWINPEATPARVSLSITTVLTMITLMETVQYGLPQVSVIRALDVFLATCLLYCTLALVEYAVVSHARKQHAKPAPALSTLGSRDGAGTLTNSRTLNGDATRFVPSDTHPQRQHLLGEAEVLDEKGNRAVRPASFLLKLDKISRVVFPLSFLVINVIYWPVCFYTASQNQYYMPSGKTMYPYEDIVLATTPNYS